MNTWAKKVYVSRVDSVVSGLRSFYKPGSKKIGLNFRAPMLIQKYENTSSYYAGETSGLYKRPP